jgi:hypothetical protein
MDIEDLLNEASPSANTEVLELKKEIADLKKEIWEYRKTLEEYGINKEAHVTNVEFICQEEIENYKNLMAGGYKLTDADAKIIDTLHKNLRQARGPLENKRLKGKTQTEEELLRIVKGSKK